ncbi:uncharacterized protein LOC132065126 [Lycium ferocissimum]|uniref:uncharacterized protein LOC132065126 n=1 Tax=Lycium ferocissimum TaxID=112874 RepID=UPI0028166476|nr:uncharacterized protein LOC132065126 [Lycium ferocissimum]
MGIDEGNTNTNAIEVNVQNQNTQNDQQSEKVHHNHPMYSHSSDTQGSSLISVLLQGSENHPLWRKSMKLVLQGKNKLGFVLGTYKKEMHDPSLHETWDRCNAMVLGWIMNTVAKNLYSIVIYGVVAHKVWEDLREVFDKVDASRAFYPHKEIGILTQGTASVSIYFSKLRELWDELQVPIPPSYCPCPESKKFIEHFQLQRLW